MEQYEKKNQTFSDEYMSGYSEKILLAPGIWILIA